MNAKTISNFREEAEKSLDVLSTGFQPSEVYNFLEKEEISNALQGNTPFRKKEGAFFQHFLSFLV